MVQIIVLAAGQGLRMGGANKLLLPFRGRSVLESTLSKICAADIGQVLVVTGHQRELIAPLLRAYEVRQVFNPDYATGMTGSIQTGVRASEVAAGYMICLADMPMISAAAYRLLAQRFSVFLEKDEQCIVLPKFGEIKGNPVIFAASYRDAILQHAEPEGCKGIVQANAAHVSWIAMPDDSVLRDLDTPEDYRALENV